MLFFLYRIHFLHLSSCTRKSLLIFPGRWRLSSKVLVFRNKNATWRQLLVSSQRLGFPYPFLMLKLFLQNFYTLFIAYIFYVPKVFLKEALMYFFAGCFLVAWAVLWSRRNVFRLNHTLIRCMLYIGSLQALGKYL